MKPLVADGLENSRGVGYTCQERYRAHRCGAYELHCFSHEEDDVLLCDDLRIVQEVYAQRDVEQRQGADDCVGPDDGHGCRSSRAGFTRSNCCVPWVWFGPSRTDGRVQCRVSQRGVATSDPALAETKQMQGSGV
jgi:hypothetical protein